MRNGASKKRKRLVAIQGRDQGGLELVWGSGNEVRSGEKRLFRHKTEILECLDMVEQKPG